MTPPLGSVTRYGTLLSPLYSVRDEKERIKGFIPGSIHIPLNELRARIKEIPRDREIILACQSGQRSYYASRILMLQGFQCRNLSGDYQTGKLFKASVEKTR